MIPEIGLIYASPISRLRQLPRFRRNGNHVVKMENEEIVRKCRVLLEAYKDGSLGYMKMPEDASPKFTDDQRELRLAYFTLPMSLNYQRDSYKLWESALITFNDPVTSSVFDIKVCAAMSPEQLRELLTRHKVALQQNKHIATWHTIAKTIVVEWGSFGGLLEAVGYDFIMLRDTVQVLYKKGFPYLSGPKIFNYWCFILQAYGGITLKNADQIDIAPDTHITKCSVVLGVITQQEADSLSKEEISDRWRRVLRGSGINPIDMHPPLWFWSRNDFLFKFGAVVTAQQL